MKHSRIVLGFSAAIAIACGVHALSPRSPSTSVSTPLVHAPPGAAPTSEAAPLTTITKGQPAKAPVVTPEKEPVLAAVRAAANDPSAAGTKTLADTLDDPDVVVRLEAIDALVERHHQPTLARLLKMDPVREPYLGPTILVGIGELGRTADPSSKKAALDRLLSLLASEKDRNGSDSAGNVVTIVESIGNLGHPDGAGALEKELGDDYHDLAGKTAIVQSLGKLGQPSSAEALNKLRAQVTAAAPNDEDYTKELKKELVAAIDAASHTGTK